MLRPTLTYSVISNLVGIYESKAQGWCLNPETGSCDWDFSCSPCVFWGKFYVSGGCLLLSTFFTLYWAVTHCSSFEHLEVLLYKPRMKKWIRGFLLHGVSWFMQWWLNICVTFQGIDRQLSEWQRCLQSCLTLLQSAVGTFNSVSPGEVLDEVIGSVEGKAYLHSKTFHWNIWVMCLLSWFLWFLR